MCYTAEARRWELLNMHLKMVETLGYGNQWEKWFQIEDIKGHLWLRRKFSLKLSWVEVEFSNDAEGVEINICILIAKYIGLL